VKARFPNWDYRLFVFIDENRFVPYAWGTNDCVTFVADAVWAMTGEDPIADIRGQWDSEESAAALLNSLGGLKAAVDARFPLRDNINFTMRGDICASKVAGNWSLGICTGAFMTAPSPEGASLVPVHQIRFSWKV
jgi:hypothetical protein